MSIPLVSAVFESALDLWLMPYAAAYASFANHDGSRVFPSVARIAKILDRSPRQVRRALAELRRTGVLIAEPSGVRNSLRYTFQASRLPRTTDGRQFLMSFPQGDRRKCSA